MADNAYKVIATRWRPKTLGEVVGQRHVTQTLRNAFGSGRIAQAFVFAGPRGVGKTTTARILARMLNCEHGPTADPCGECDACREIAQDRDMDVLEIDAATHTGIDNVREVIIAGLAMKPVRDRYKIFIIDEVHQLSTHSFNALLKSIEEPPPHVVFIMATTAPEKIPDTIVSRSQLFEFKAISSRDISVQLQKIADDVDDPINVSPEAVALIARAAEGSMRDAETALDQVLAFSGNAITVEDVATVLGLVGRDLLFDAMTAVADENGAAAFELAARAVEAGYDLRLLCRELSRLVRDLLVLSIDPTRMQDADVAPERDHDRLTALLPRFSREDLLRAFDLLTKAEFDIKNAAEPRYHLEMALLKWIHLRKLTPIATLLGQLGGANQAPAPPSRQPAPGVQSRPAPASSASVAKRVGASQSARPAAAPPAAAEPPAGMKSAPVPSEAAPNPPAATPVASADAGQDFVTAFKAEAQKERPGTYGTVLAQAPGIELRGNRVVISVPSAFLAGQVTTHKAWLEAVAQRVAGRRVPVVAEVIGSPSSTGRQPAGPAADDLLAAAKAHPGVQTLLEIFPADIKDVTELK